MHAAVSFRCRRIALLQEGPHRRQSGKESAVRSARGCRVTWAGVDYSVYTPGRTCWVVVLELVLRQKGSTMRISGRKHVIGGLLLDRVHDSLGTATPNRRPMRQKPNRRPEEQKLAKTATVDSMSRLGGKIRNSAEGFDASKSSAAQNPMFFGVDF